MWKCHSLTGHTRNCHRANLSVWWPHTYLSNRRAISYPAGKRRTGLSSAVQPNLFRDRGKALPTRATLAEHPPTGDANRITPEHNQQGVPPARNRWRGRSNGRVGHLRTRQSTTAEIKTPAHIRNRGVKDLDQEVRKCIDGLLVLPHLAAKPRIVNKGN